MAGRDPRRGACRRTAGWPTYRGVLPGPLRPAEASRGPAADRGLIDCQWRGGAGAALGPAWPRGNGPARPHALGALLANRDFDGLRYYAAFSMCVRQRSANKGLSPTLLHDRHAFVRGQIRPCCDSGIVPAWARHGPGSRSHAAAPCRPHVVAVHALRLRRYAPHGPAAARQGLRQWWRELKPPPKSRDGDDGVAGVAGVADAAHLPRSRSDSLTVNPISRPAACGLAVLGRGLAGSLGAISTHSVQNMAHGAAASDPGCPQGKVALSQVSHFVTQRNATRRRASLPACPCDTPRDDTGRSAWCLAPRRAESGRVEPPLRAAPRVARPLVAASRLWRAPRSLQATARRRAQARTGRLAAGGPTGSASARGQG